ncbi:hypothetical protein, partial [Serratia marcescens]|uniref:hypothetical protein n=1 Tax=Serratia marcescens TaxID=615 RepID=UPI0019530950
KPKSSIALAMGSGLSLKAQLKWKLTYIECQHDYIINEGFYRNQILGEWIDEVSIYDAILLE